MAQFLPLIRIVAGAGLLFVAYQDWLRHDLMGVTMALAITLLATK